MKLIFKVSIFMFVAVFATVGSAMAVPTTLKDITKDIAGTEKYKDIGAEGFTLTDTDGVNDDATAFLMLELAGFKDANTFGIYGFTVENGVVVKQNTLEIFEGSDNAPTSVTLSFKDGTVTNDWSKETIDIKPLQFGFYLTTPEKGGQIYYTHTELNDDGFDHAMVFDTSDNSVKGLNGSDIVVAFEDLWGGGDQDYTDMVIGITDIAPVPEPGTLVLMGLGLFGLAGIGRKRYKK